MTDRGGGSIVNLIGAMVYLGKHGHAHSYGSKLGLEGQIRQLATELGADGIRINGVSPGLIDVDRTRTEEGIGSSESDSIDPARAARGRRGSGRRLLFPRVGRRVVRDRAGVTRQRRDLPDADAGPES